MDDIDRQILGLLSQDAEMSQAAIGRAVGLAPSSVNERIRKLKDAGVIRRFTIEIDADKAGYPILAFMGVTLGTPAAATAFMELAVQQPEVLECHHVTGAWNFLLKIRVRSTTNLEDLLNRFKTLKTMGKTETIVVLYPHKEIHGVSP